MINRIMYVITILPILLMMAQFKQTCTVFILFILATAPFITRGQKNGGPDQSDSSVYIKQFGWTLQVPRDFEMIDSSELSARKNEGSKSIQELKDQKIDVSGIVDLIALKKDGWSNYFLSNCNKSDNVTAENWDKADDSARKMIFDVIHKKIPYKPEMKSSIVFIDGIRFKKTENIYRIEHSILRMAYLATFYKGYYLSISYQYVNKDAGREILRIIETSKFDKSQ